MAIIQPFHASQVETTLQFMGEKPHTAPLLSLSVNNIMRITHSYEKSRIFMSLLVVPCCLAACSTANRSPVAGKLTIIGTADLQGRLDAAPRSVHITPSGEKTENTTGSSLCNDLSPLAATACIMTRGKPTRHFSDTKNFLFPPSSTLHTQ